MIKSIHKDIESYDKQQGTQSHLRGSQLSFQSFFHDTVMRMSVSMVSEGSSVRVIPYQKSGNEELCNCILY